MLLFGLATDSVVETAVGSCHSLASKPVPCKMQVLSSGRVLVTDYKVDYKFRQVWWGVYDMSINSTPYKAAHCTKKDLNLLCKNTFSFISDYETSSPIHSRSDVTLSNPS